MPEEAAARVSTGGDRDDLTTLTLIADRLDRIERRQETIEHALVGVPDTGTAEAKVIDAKARAAWWQAVIDCPGRIGAWANTALGANPALRSGVTALATAGLGAVALKSPDIINAILALLQHKAGTP